MKTYFMSWETNHKQGDVCWDFEDTVSPREALTIMRKDVAKNIPDDTSTLVVLQFNNVV